MKVESKVTVLFWLLVMGAAAASVLGGAEGGDRDAPKPVPSVESVTGVELHSGDRHTGDQR
jgi:hypothetical protein